MSKVLVDRELLERVTALLEWDGMDDTAPLEFGAKCDSLCKELSDCIAQPAEAEGVVIAAKCVNRKRLRHHAMLSDYGLTLPHGEALVRQTDHLAALSAVTAERDRLREENERLKARPEQALSEALGERLMQSSAENYIETTFGVDGTDGDIVVTLRRSAGKTPHELRMEAEAERDQLRAEVETLRKDAVRWRYVRLQGDDTHWLNLLRVDLDEFGGNINAAVDALIDGEAPAMAAKEA